MVRNLICLIVVGFLFVPSTVNAQITIFGAAPPPEPDSYSVELTPWVYRGKMVHRGARFSGTGPGGVATAREQSRKFTVKGDVHYNRAVDRDGSPGHGVVISTTAGYPAIPPPALVPVVTVRRYYYVAPRRIYIPHDVIYVLP